MYQFYYSQNTPIKQAQYAHVITDFFDVSSVRETMWEEHCLECSAPYCYKTCKYYEKRTDGRCMRFSDGIFVYENNKGVCNQAARIKFRQWGNLLTLIYPNFLSIEEYTEKTVKNQKIGNALKKLTNSFLPTPIKWNIIRTKEYLRRRSLKKKRNNTIPDAFAFHGFSFENEPFKLIVEIFNSKSPISKISIDMKPGENIQIFEASIFQDAAFQANNRIKVYPENNIEAEIEILWCDFVTGKKKTAEAPADKVKCLVWDLDNTVWDGIFIETDDPSTLKLRDNIKEIIVELDKRGIIQSIASKNDYDVVWSTVEKLGIADYFIYPQINWGPKSNSIKEIASNLNIGIDSLALVDDSVFERNEVKTAYPEVRVYDIDVFDLILTLDEFNVPVTEESQRRREMYKSEEKRNIIKQNSGSNLTDFLKNCNLIIEVFEPVKSDDIKRSYELIVRTNQLNMSGIKYSYDEFISVLQKENHMNFAISCHDNYGSYGTVGFGQYLVKDSVIIFTEFALSCRVAGKYVESALFSSLLKKENCKMGFFTINKTKKNLLLRNTLEEIGFIKKSESGNTITYLFNTDLKNQDIVKVVSE